MARKLRAATFEQINQLGDAVSHLRKARDLLRSGGARTPLARVRRALASAGGAHRHAVAAFYRGERTR